MDLSSGPATQTCDVPSYYWQYYGEAMLLIPWTSGQGSTFIPNDYDLPRRSPQDLPQDLTGLTVAVPNSKITFDQFMTFVCKFGPVHIALWAPSKSWATYRSAVDAQNCFRELLEKGYEVGLTNSPWNLPSWTPN